MTQDWFQLLLNSSISLMLVENIFLKPNNDLLCCTFPEKIVVVEQKPHI